MTDRLTHREENKSKKRPQTAPTVSFLGNGSLPVSRESTPNQHAGAALRGGLFWTLDKRKEHYKYEENHDRTATRTNCRTAAGELSLQLYWPGVRTIPQYRKSICQRKGFAASGTRKTKQKSRTPRSAAIAINHCRKQSGGERCSAQTIAAPNGTEKTGKLRKSGLDFSGQESDEWWQEVKIMRIEEIPVRPKSLRSPAWQPMPGFLPIRMPPSTHWKPRRNTTRIILRRTRTGSWLPSTQTMGFPVRPSTARSSIACCRTAGG